MPDLDTLLRERLDAPVSVVAPPLRDLRDRAWRARQRRLTASAVAVVAVLTLVGVGTSGNGLGLPGWTQDTAHYATGATLPAVLDEGTGPDGEPWRLQVDTDDGWCLRVVTPGEESAACRLSDPARLDEATTRSVPDRDGVLLVVAGPAPLGTISVEVRTPRERASAPARVVAGRVFFSARLAGDLAPGDPVTLTALDVDGAVLAGASMPFLPPPPSTAPVGPPPPPAGTPEAECERAYQQQVGREYPDISEQARQAFLRGCVEGYLVEEGVGAVPPPR